MRGKTLFSVRWKKKKSGGRHTEWAGSWQLTTGKLPWLRYGIEPHGFIPGSVRRLLPCKWKKIRTPVLVKSLVSNSVQLSSSSSSSFLLPPACTPEQWLRASRCRYTRRIYCGYRIYFGASVVETALGREHRYSAYCLGVVSRLARGNLPLWWDSYPFVKKKKKKKSTVPCGCLLLVSDWHRMED